jgi:hypothetical protein
MKIVLATAAILAALAAPSFAETVGTDAAGSDQGSFRLSQVDPSALDLQQVRAQDVKKMSTRSYSRHDNRGGY